MKNNLFLILYLIAFAFFVVRVTLYRLYLLTIFLLRLGGAVVAGLVAAGAFYLLRGIQVGSVAPPAGFALDWLAAQRDAVLSAKLLVGIYDPVATYGYELVCAMIGVGVFLILRVAARIVAPVFYSFPMPRRPLAPIRRWEPPKHVIPSVPCAIVTPPHQQPLWSGEWSEITARLPSSFKITILHARPLIAPMHRRFGTVQVAVAFGDKLIANQRARSNIDTLPSSRG